ncbi:hypothetical protein EDC04DRAFT_1353878 [Pisolithus marmoratus]|nr:hypothetical protein EDC04DRAFT_1353878 [Pisolithus marmoratus]
MWLALFVVSSSRLSCTVRAHRDRPLEGMWNLIQLCGINLLPHLFAPPGLADKNTDVFLCDGTILTCVTLSYLGCFTLIIT